MRSESQKYHSRNRAQFEGTHKQPLLSPGFSMNYVREPPFRPRMGGPTQAQLLAWDKHRTRMNEGAQ